MIRDRTPGDIVRRHEIRAVSHLQTYSRENESTQLGADCEISPDLGVPKVVQMGVVDLLKHWPVPFWRFDVCLPVNGNVNARAT